MKADIQLTSIGYEVTFYNNTGWVNSQVFAIWGDAAAAIENWISIPYLGPV